MPIDITNLTQSAKTVQTYNPKFFSSKLTGSGKTQGVLNQARNPGNVMAPKPMTSQHLSSRKRQYTNGGTSIYELPFNVLTQPMWNYMKKYRPNDKAMSSRVCIGNMTTIANCDIYLDMTVHSIIMDETRNQNGIGYDRRISPCYQIFLYFEFSKGQDEYVNVPFTRTVGNVRTITGQKENAYTFGFTTDPRTDFEKIRYDLDSQGCYVDVVAMQDYLADFSLYAGVCRESEVWQTNCHELIEQVLQNVDHTQDVTTLNDTANMLLALEQYPIPLDIYRPIYQSIARHFTHDRALVLCKQNLNLLLNDTLFTLNAKKSRLSQIPNPTQPVPTKIPLSKAQLAAVTTNEPLVLVQSGAGSGKALEIHTPILTPNGWIEIGKLKVGDEIIGSNGKPCHVLRIHEQGLKAGYKLTFRDRSSVIACGEHLWTVITNDNKKGERRSTITTEQWINSYHKTHSYLPMVEPVDFTEKKLPIDPYLMGALLADGCFCQNSIQYTKSETAVYKETARAAKTSGFKMYDATCRTSTAKQWRFSHENDKEHYSELRNTIKELGLFGLKSGEKFIPEIYLFGSIEQRRALLAGLFDGDGRVRNARGYAQYHTKSEKLAKDVCQLCWSLGLTAKKTITKHPRGNYWCVALFDYNPFRASEFKNKCTGTVKTMRRSLISAEPIDPVPMRCIEVDAEDKLYVTKDFIVTHNSTVILNRLNYMVNSGVKPEDITVISFTNAAADHIKEEQSLVHSMTACAMINTIYKANFPNHELNTMESLASTIKALYSDIATNPRHKIAKRFADHIDNMENKRGNSQESNPQTRLNNFVEHHLDEVLKILDEVGQTTLELQIIICYQLIDKLVEPDEIKTKYLIIDEVQDNSVFEFIYFLRYAYKNDASLFMVGDCSQTLYEFRASNPKALNTLEGSGIFETHRLDINYRSNQEILDFANVTLSHIEANQYANIQLKANALTPVTAQSFKEKVQLSAYQCSKKSGQFNQKLPEILKTDLKAWLDDKLQKKEQVAFMSFPRVQVMIIEKTLKEMYPGAKIVSIMSDKQKSTTLFTRFITGYWNEVHWAPTPDLDTIIGNLLTAKLPYLLHRQTDEARQSAMLQIARWRQENSRRIKIWSTQYGAGQITLDKLLMNTMQNMIDFEVHTNSVAQLLLSQRNNDRKNEQDLKGADFILSTIHAAKGREFPHCVVIYKDSADLSEPDKRMYYVALTRAMKSEYIIAYDTYDNPEILGQYQMVLDALEAKSGGGQNP